MKTTTNTGKNQKKISRKALRKCRNILNYNFFSGNFIYDPLDVFYKPLGTINIKIMRLDLKSNQNFFKKLRNFVLKS